ncbi:hypothetical protein MUJ63_10115 [Lachnospiraceae bacterium NSJ-143]|nr:hypothetical protein [Lachnospiraceae bacterium NSJ-143]
MNTTNYNADSISKYSIDESLLKGNNTQKKEDFDLISVYLLYLSNSSDKSTEGIIRLLSILLSNEVPKEEKLTILENEFDIKPTRELEKEVSVMCNLSEGIERKSIEKGLEKGIQALVETLKEMDIPENKIIERLLRNTIFQ